MAALCCRVAIRALALVSEPVTAVPSQPSTGERKGERGAGAAIQVPMTMVCADWS